LEVWEATVDRSRGDNRRLLFTGAEATEGMEGMVLSELLKAGRMVLKEE